MTDEATGVAGSQEVERLRARVHELETRLEMNRAWRMNPDTGEPEEVAVEPGSIPDGIECRDATIREQDREIDRLRAQRNTARAEALEEAARVADAELEKQRRMQIRAFGIGNDRSGYECLWAGNVAFNIGLNIRALKDAP